MVGDARIGAGAKSGVGTIAPCLWFDGQAEDAARYYVSLFEDAAIEQVRHYSEEVAAVSGGVAGSVLVVKFRLPGIRVLAMNAGPTYQLSPAVSLMINCDTQEQVDFYWEKLSAGGAPLHCGWVTDMFGLSWQVQWSKFDELLEADHAKGERMFLALLQMQKIDIAALQRAWGE